MEPARIRIGWMKMLLALFRRTGGEARYGDLIRALERLIADAAREIEEEAGRVR